MKKQEKQKNKNDEYITLEISYEQLAKVRALAKKQTGGKKVTKKQIDKIIIEAIDSFCTNGSGYHPAGKGEGNAND